MQAEGRGLEAQAHTVDLGRDATGGRAQSLERVADKGITLRTGDHPHLPGTPEREAMGRWPWCRHEFVRDHMADG